MAHQNYNQETGKYRAFGEGSSLSSGWVWEWVILPDGKTWTVIDSSNEVAQAKPTMFTKVSFGFLAVYNTTFAKNMSVYIEKTIDNSDRGYNEGVDESGQPVFSLGVHTNDLIVEAARYAIEARP